MGNPPATPRRDEKGGTPKVGDKVLNEYRMSATRSKSSRAPRRMHHIDPRIDAERDALVRDLATAGRIVVLSWRADFCPAARGRNGGGDRYETDRRLVDALLAGDEWKLSREPLPEK